MSTQIDILLHGVPGRSSQGYLGQASSVLVDERTMVDVGSIARRPLLQKSFEKTTVEPGDVEDVLLTHIHFDHCDNVDMFPNATHHIYAPEMERVEDGDYDWATPRNASSMFEDLDVELFDIGDEIAGMEVVPAPGHTEHHVGFIREAEGQTVGFTGDAVKNTREVATRDPMVLYDKDEAIETINRICNRADFVVPGHDTPFYITDDGQPVATIDVDFGVNLQMSPDSATTTQLTSNRSELRELPSFVNDITGRQEFH